MGIEATKSFIDTSKYVAEIAAKFAEKVGGSVLGKVSNVGTVAIKTGNVSKSEIKLFNIVSGKYLGAHIVERGSEGNATMRIVKENAKGRPTSDTMIFASNPKLNRYDGFPVGGLSGMPKDSLTAKEIEYQTTKFNRFGKTTDYKNGRVALDPDKSECMIEINENGVITRRIAEV